MSMKRCHITATIKIKHTFKCDKCGKEKEGDTTVLSYSGHDPSAIERAVNESKPEAKDMPIGWHSYYGKTRTQFNCGCEK